MKTVVTLAALIAAAFASSVQAQDGQEEGKWLVRGRALSMQVDNKNSTTSLVPAIGEVAAENKVFPEVDFTYFITPHIAAELILTYPQKHDVTLGGTFIGTVKHLPPTLTVQYHFLPDSTFRPYIGAGVNYTRFMSVDLDAGRKLGGSIPLEVDRNSFGLAGQIGMDVKVAKNWFVNVDAKYVNIETTVKVKDSSAVLPGTTVTDLKIDPWLFSVGLGYRF